MKKLITLVSTKGKTPEEVARELVKNLYHYSATTKGLRQCKKCGEYKGNYGRQKVECICSSVTCPRCSMTPMHRPVSYYYDLARQKVWHVPYFRNICSECNNERNPQAELVQYYIEKREYFSILSDAELIELKRKSKRNTGWVARRAYYETALSEEIKHRGLQPPE